ncbi:unnamed protein product, partial [Amoebophrya sp. A25]|eukprot:GSA25T00004927001.1
MSVSAVPTSVSPKQDTDLSSPQQRHEKGQSSSLPRKQGNENCGPSPSSSSSGPNLTFSGNGPVKHETPKAVRLKPWVAKNLFGKDRTIAASFPADLLTDANTVLFYLRKKRKVKLGPERIARVEEALDKHWKGSPEATSTSLAKIDIDVEQAATSSSSTATYASTTSTSSVPPLQLLATLVEKWRVEAQSIGFCADSYYDTQRVESYSKRLTGTTREEVDVEGSGTKRQKLDTGGVGEHPTAPVTGSNQDDSEQNVDPGSGGSQSALARTCVACLDTSSNTPKIFADYGCGSGLSSCEFPSDSFVLGFDASRAMLERFAGNVRGHIVAGHSGCRSAPKITQPSFRGDAIFADLSQGVPLRPGVLDGAISVACLHYLCTTGSDNRSGKERYRTFVRTANAAAGRPQSSTSSSGATARLGSSSGRA